MTKKVERVWPISLLFGFFLVALVVGVATSMENLEFQFSYFALLPAMSVAITIYLIYSLSRNKSTVKSVLWLILFLVATVLWGLTDIMALTAANRETGLMARMFVPIAGFIGAPAFYIFIKDMTSEKSEKYLGVRSLMFFTMLAYLAIALTTNLMLVRDPNQLIERFWGYELTFGPLSILYVIMAQVFLVLSAATLIRFYRSRKQRKQKQQAKIFLISVMVPIVGISVANFWPALLNLPFIPIDSLFVAIMSAGLVYGLNKYSLFTVSPTQIANNILETMSEGVMVVNNDLEVHYINRSASEMLNFNQEIDSNEAYLESFLGGKDFEEIQNYLKKNKVIHSKKRFPDMFVIAKKTGARTQVEISVSSVMDDRDKNAGYVFVISDMSDLQKAFTRLAEEEKKVEKKVVERTEELYEEHAKLEASIAGLPIGFIMLDESMKVVEQNEVARKLFSTRENNWWYVQDALGEMGVDKKLLKRLERGDIVDIPEVAKGNRFLHIIISPIIRDGKILGRVILIEDITEQKAAERERNEFVITASHEIRTPLSVIQGNLSNALDMSSKIDPVLRPLINSAYKASNQISALFKDILIVSDIENEARPKQKFETTFNLKDAVTEVVEHLEPSAKEKKLNLGLKITGKNIEVAADRDEVKECILKLIDNGIKFTKKGSVEVEVSKKPSKIVVRVLDSGQGISKTEENRLFRKFIRLDNSLKREVGGAGLGLYIARALAERNNGELILESSSKKGSVFCLTLPGAE